MCVSTVNLSKSTRVRLDLSNFVSLTVIREMSDESCQTENNNNEYGSHRTNLKLLPQDMDRLSKLARAAWVNNGNKQWLLFLVVMIAIVLTWSQPEADPDLFVKTPQLIESRGFQCQEHFIQTSDGYIIALHRIVNPLVKTTGRPVLFWHGVEASSREFLINDGKGSINESTDVVGNNIGFELAKRGYDVWLANSRGNVYSRNHTVLDPEKDKEFWNFSYDEMIEHDLPNTIEYILDKTQRKTLGFVGHSQGNMVMFGLMATQSKYNDMVKPFIALAPVAMVNKVGHLLSFLAHRKMLINFLVNYGGPVMPSNRFEELLGYTTCSSFLKYCCILFNGFIEGHNWAQLNISRYPVYISEYPAGASAKNIAHLALNARSSFFGKFDYGHEGNIAKYASSLPPEYFLQKITNKHIALFSALNDPIASQGNVDNIRTKLKVKLLDDYVVPFDQWNHVDFLLGLEAGKYVNGKMLDIFAKYNTK